jgi:hypothetical protein
MLGELSSTLVSLTCERRRSVELPLRYFRRHSKRTQRTGATHFWNTFTFYKISCIGPGVGNKKSGIPPESQGGQNQSPML